MRVDVIHDVVTVPVPRDTCAPWLDAKTTKVRLIYPFVFRVMSKKYGLNVVIVVPAGYVFDWASIPKIVQGVYPSNYSEARRGSAAHDYLYSHLYHYFTKAFADDVLVAFMEVEGASTFTRRAFHLAVSVGGKGGWAYAKRKNPDPHWSYLHERIFYDPSSEISTSPVTNTEWLRSVVGGSGRC